VEDLKKVSKNLSYDKLLPIRESKPGPIEYEVEEQGTKELNYI